MEGMQPGCTQSSQALASSVAKLREVMGGIAQRWRELSGEDNWEGLLSPLDVDLRRYIIHYGERTAACENAFNDKKASKGYGFSLYPPEKFFSRLCLQRGNPYKYTVTSFFYALTEVKLFTWTLESASVWMGTVAVTTDEGKESLGRRDIMIAWRGTASTAEWIKDFQFGHTSAKDLFGETHDPKVHYGFHSIYTAKSSDHPFSQTSARDQILKEVRRLVDKYQDEEISITVTGHSLGAALATLTAMDIAANGYNKPTGKDKSCMVTAFAYASPRVGDRNFRKVFNKLNTEHDLHILRIRNSTDPVPTAPPELFGYIDVGVELGIDTTLSPYLKPNINPHDLENYLHGVAGVQEKEKFELVIARDISLVNKYLDGVKDEHSVPPNWWTNDRNKNMIQQDDGSWVLEDYVPDPPTVTA